MRGCRAEVEPDVAEVVPCLTNRIVEDGECAAGGERMTEEVIRRAMDAVICEDVRLICERAHHI